MKITFILPALGKKPGGGYIKTWTMEPLAIAQLSALTPRYVVQKFFDDRIEEINFNDPTDLVAISVETYTAKRAYEISAQYRKKGIKVILGGVHPTLMPNEAIEFADSVVVGEAEGAWETVISDAEKGCLKKFYRYFSKDFHREVYPNRDIFIGKKYLPLSLVETSRGCCFACNFCSVTAFYRGLHKYRDVNDVVKEIRDMKNKKIFFVDDNIGADIYHAKELCKALIPLHIKWVSQISVSALRDSALVTLMAESGCVGILVGIESLNEQNLVQMNKSWNIYMQSYQEGLKNLRDHGIAAYATFLFGYDEDDSKTFEKVFKFSIEQKFYLVAYNHLIPFPGTPLYSHLDSEKRLLFNKWWIDQDYRFGDIPFQPKKLSARQLADRCIEFRKRFYSARSIFRRIADTRANAKNIWMAMTYILLNILFRKEIDQRSGLIIGTK